MYTYAHTISLTSEVFGSKRCDCREQLHKSLRIVQDKGGLVIYLQQEGRGIGIANKIAAYNLQDGGMDTIEANEHLGFKDELREYDAIPGILQDMGIQSIQLMTNNPYKIEQLRALGVNITSRVPIEIKANEHSRRYLESKKNRMRHLLSDDSLREAEVVLGPMIASVGVVNSSVCDEQITREGILPLQSSMGISMLRSGSTPQPVEKTEHECMSILQSRNTSYIFGKSSVEAGKESAYTIHTIPCYTMLYLCYTMLYTLNTLYTLCTLYTLYKQSRL